MCSTSPSWAGDIRSLITSSPGEEINPYRSFYGISLYDGKRVLINSKDVIGVLSPDKLPAYAKLALSKLAGPASSETATAD